MLVRDSSLKSCFAVSTTVSISQVSKQKVCCKSRIVSNESFLLLKGGAYSAGALIRQVLLPRAVIRSWKVIRSLTVRRKNSMYLY